MKTKTLKDKNGNPIQIEQSQVRGLKEALANVGSGGSGDVNNKAKLIRQYYLQNGNTFDLHYNGYNEPLKLNQFYLFYYYNDEWGKATYFINVPVQEGENNGFKWLSEIVMSSYGEVPVSVSFTYTYNRLINGGIPCISASCQNDNFVVAEGMDYVEIYELPFTLEIY